MGGASSRAMHPTMPWWHGRTTLFKRLLKINSGPTFISRRGSDSIILMPSSPPHSPSYVGLFSTADSALRRSSFFERESYVELRRSLQYGNRIGCLSVDIEVSVSFSMRLIRYSLLLTARLRESIPRMI